MFGVDGEVVGSISVCGPAYRMQRETRETIIPHLQRAADEVSRALGWRGGLPGRGDEGCVVSALVRSWLYVPGHHPDRVAKGARHGGRRRRGHRPRGLGARRAKGGGADRQAAALASLAICPAATTGVGADQPAAHAMGRRRTWPRSPALDPTVSGFRARRSRLRSASVAEALGCPLQLLLETARGLMAAPELASAHPTSRASALGEADLAADLRVGASSWPRLGSGMGRGRLACGRPPLAGPERLHRRRDLGGAAQQHDRRPGRRGSSAARGPPPPDRAGPRGVPADRRRDGRARELVDAMDERRGAGRGGRPDPRRALRRPGRRRRRRSWSSSWRPSTRPHPTAEIRTEENR